MSDADVCDECGLARTCIWSALGPEEHERLIAILHIRERIRRGQQIFRTGEPLRALYILRSGSVKTWNVTEDGEERIIRFFMPGEVLGLGAINSGHYDCYATTLDNCSLCEVPFNQFQRLAEDIPGLNRQLLRMMSLELVQEEQMMLFRGNRSAAARIASFLDYLGRTQQARGYSHKEFNLAMGRREIANYLGLALETVSRTLSNFQEQGVLRVDGKHIRVVDEHRLRAQIGSQSFCHPAGGGVSRDGLRDALPLSR